MRAVAPPARRSSASRCIISGCSRDRAGPFNMQQDDVRGRLQADLKAAVRAHDSVRASTLRLVLAALADAEADVPDGEAGLDDNAIQDLIRRLCGHCDQATASNRVESAKVRELRRAERAVLAEYLPEPMGDAEVAQAVEQAVTAAKACSIRDLGRTMAELRKICSTDEDLARARREARRRLET